MQSFLTVDIAFLKTVDDQFRPLNCYCSLATLGWTTNGVKIAGIIVGSKVRAVHQGSHGPRWKLLEMALD
jgi:hypothetical protein